VSCDNVKQEEEALSNIRRTRRTDRIAELAAVGSLYLSILLVGSGVAANTILLTRRRSILLSFILLNLALK